MRRAKIPCRWPIWLYLSSCSQVHLLSRGRALRLCRHVLTPRTLATSRLPGKDKGLSMNFERHGPAPLYILLLAALSLGFLFSDLRPHVMRKTAHRVSHRHLYDPSGGASEAMPPWAVACRPGFDAAPTVVGPSFDTLMPPAETNYQALAPWPAALLPMPSVARQGALLSIVPSAMGLAISDPPPETSG